MKIFIRILFGLTAVMLALPARDSCDAQGSRNKKGRNWIEIECTVLGTENEAPPPANTLKALLITKDPIGTDGKLDTAPEVVVATIEPAKSTPRAGAAPTAESITFRISSDSFDTERSYTLIIYDPSEVYQPWMCDLARNVRTPVTLLRVPPNDEADVEFGINLFRVQSALKNNRSKSSDDIGKHLDRWLKRVRSIEHKPMTGATKP